MRYLRREDVRRAIGARTGFAECNSRVTVGFQRTGDSGSPLNTAYIRIDQFAWMDAILTIRWLDARSYLPTLTHLVQSGLQVLLWAGDADWICNWAGNYDVANALEFNGQEEFRAKELQPYTVNGVQRGTVKSVEGFTFMRVFEAGHEVPYYRGFFLFYFIFLSLHGPSIRGLELTGDYAEPETSLQVFRQVLEGKGIYST